MIEQVAEHSVDLSLIKRDSKVLDLGCRSFGFANAMLDFVDEVYCVDADASVKTDDPRIHLINVAVGAENKIQEFIVHGNGTGNYLDNGEPRPTEYKSEFVQVWTLEKICHYFGIYDWDLIKMDVEKSEIGIIKSMVRPPAKQLSIEFHVHCGTPYDDIVDCVTKLQKWYNVHVYDYSDKHGCGLNVWDSLFLLK